MGNFCTALSTDFVRLLEGKRRILWDAMNLVMELILFCDTRDAFSLLGHEGAVGGGRKHGDALDVLPAERALGDELGARLAHGAVAAGPRHRYARLRHTDDALTHGALLQGRELRARIPALCDALQP